MDAENLPFNIYGTWNKSHLDNEDLQQELLTHLQGIGKYICAQDVSWYMAHSKVKKKYSMKKSSVLQSPTYSGQTPWTLGNPGGFWWISSIT